MWNAVVIVSCSQTAFFFCMELGKISQPHTKEKKWSGYVRLLRLCNRVVYTFRIPVLREEGFSKKDKRITMAQYENGLRKDSFVNRTQ